MSSPRSRQSLHNYPNVPCSENEYQWNNGFSSGCKPKAEDRRRLALQFARGRSSQVMADGYDGGQYPPNERLKTQLLGILRRSRQPVPTLELARAVYGPSASKRMVNPSLYSLLSQGRVSKITDIGDVNPHWIFVR